MNWIKDKDNLNEYYCIVKELTFILKLDTLHPLERFHSYFLYILKKGSPLNVKGLNTTNLNEAKERSIVYISKWLDVDKWDF